MLKQNGFTLIELIVVMTIIAILGAIAVPNFANWMGKNRLSEQTIELYDVILQARSFGLSEKVCPNNIPAKDWRISIDATTQTFSLSCTDQDDTLVAFETFSLDTGISLLAHPTMAPESQDQAHLVFSTQSLGSDVFLEDLNVFEDGVRIILSDNKNSKTLCFESIAAFPTINQNGTTCP